MSNSGGLFYCSKVLVEFYTHFKGDPKAAVYSHTSAGIYFLRRKRSITITPASNKGKTLGSGTGSSGVA